MIYADENEKCHVCFTRGVDLHHIKSRKSGGCDNRSNIIPLCRKHHSEIHSSGINKFILKYPRVKDWLIKNGWEFFNNKWLNTKKEGENEY